MEFEEMKRTSLVIGEHQQRHGDVSERGACSEQWRCSSDWSVFAYYCIRHSFLCACYMKGTGLGGETTDLNKTATLIFKTWCFWK